MYLLSQSWKGEELRWGIWRKTVNRAKSWGQFYYFMLCNGLLLWVLKIKTGHLYSAFSWVYSPLRRSEWHVLTRDHTVLPATHTLIHEWNEPSCLWPPAAANHRTLAGTHLLFIFSLGCMHLIMFGNYCWPNAFRVLLQTVITWIILKLGWKTLGNSWNFSSKRVGTMGNL